jgi:hypothetical protein
MVKNSPITEPQIRKRVYRVAIDITNAFIIYNRFEMIDTPSMSIHVVVWRRSETWQLYNRVYTPTITSLLRLMSLIKANQYV